MTEHTLNNETADTLHHNIIELPNGKKAKDIVGERHDMVLLVEVSKANPNGDPDTGNMPRLQPDNMRGLMTDVCLKRKIRNFFTLYKPDGHLRPDGKKMQDGMGLFIREGAILQEQIEHINVKGKAEAIFKKWLLAEMPDEFRPTIAEALAGTCAQADQKEMFKVINELYQAAWDGKKIKSASKGGDVSDTGSKENAADKESTKKSKEKKLPPALTAFEQVVKRSSEYRERALRDALCETYFDVRYFGGVVSTEGPLKGSFYGQIRGPIQFGFAESLDRVLQLDFSITRCASASEKEAKQQGEGEGDSESSGNRTMGRKHIVDYGIYRSHIYLSPAFAAKTGFTYYDLDNFLFALQHMFTDDRSAARPGGLRVVGLVDFQHSTALGNEHAHKLFDMVKVHRAHMDGDGKPRKEFPRSIADYCGETPSGAVCEKDQGGQGNELVTANPIIWEIPKCQEKSCSA